jgi:Ca2+-binding RTX toxin-like protein
MAKIDIKNDRNKPLDITSSDNTVTVHEGVTLKSATYGIAEVLGLGGNGYVIDGSVTAKGSGNVALQMFGHDETVSIGATGQLRADYWALVSFGDGVEIENSGHIVGDTVGVGIAGDASHLVNAGEIVSRNGSALNTDYVTDFRLDNDGLMSSKEGLDLRAESLTLDFGKRSVVEFGSSGAVDILSETGWTAKITNRGEIANTDKGMINAITGGEGVENIRNTGTITGFVWLGGGDDRYDGRGGRVLDGTVGGGEGNDKYFLDNKHDSVHESVGEGYDRLTVSFSYKVLYYAEFEEIRLAGKGDFRLTGNDMANYLGGNKGDNRLTGHGGADAFFGGAGEDVMTGGADADAFYFKPNADREIVTDFIDGEDFLVLFTGKEIDSIADLLANHLHQKGDDLVISGDGTTMILRDFDKANLTDADFTS